MSKDNGRLKGQGLILVTGKKGSGKSHFVTSQIKYIIDNFPDHKVFADIDGLNIPGVEKSPDSWLDAPKNCTIIYDEAQRLPWADNSSTKINSDERVREMTMIRHENKNIVLITQDPTFIHSALRKLVDVHYHISHPFKDGKPKVFKFFGAVSQIDDKGNYKNQSVEEFTHHLSDDISKLYKSVDDDAAHDQKRKIPKKIIYMAIFAFFAMLIALVVGYFGVVAVGKFMFKDKQEVDQIIKESSGQISSSENGNDGERSVLSGFVGDKSQPVENQRIYSNYEVHKKYLQEYTLEINNDPVVLPASVIAMGGKCRAYNQYGDLLNIPNRECLDMLSEYGKIPKRRDNQGSVKKSDVFSEYREDDLNSQSQVNTITENSRDLYKQ